MYEIYQKLLDEKGLKNADVARATGISNMTLSDWKRGKSVPKADKMQKIAKYLNVSFEYLMTGKEKEISLPEQMDLWNMVKSDKDMLNALEKYIFLSDDKKKHIVDMINLLSEENKNE